PRWGQRPARADPAVANKAAAIAAPLNIRKEIIEGSLEFSPAALVGRNGYRQTANCASPTCALSMAIPSPDDNNMDEGRAAVTGRTRTWLRSWPGCGDRAAPRSRP